MRTVFSSPASVLVLGLLAQLVPPSNKKPSTPRKPEPKLLGPKQHLELRAAPVTCSDVLNGFDVKILEKNNPNKDPTLFLFCLSTDSHVTTSCDVSEAGAIDIHRAIALASSSSSSVFIGILNLGSCSDVLNEFNVKIQKKQKNNKRPNSLPVDCPLIVM